MYVDDVHSNPVVPFQFEFNNLPGQARLHTILATIVQPPLTPPLRSYNHVAAVPRYNSGPAGAPIVAGVPDFSQIDQLLVSTALQSCLLHTFTMSLGETECSTLA